MYKTKHRWLAVSLLVTLGTSGCGQFLKKPGTQSAPPEQLRIKTGPSEADSRPKDIVALEQREAKPVEFYPATGGLIGTDVAPRGTSVKEGKYTLNFEDAELNEVVKTILEDTLKVNYLLSPKVTGKVSMKTARPLAEEELIPTLESLLRMNGAVLIRQGSLYRIEPDAAALVDAPGARLGTPGQLMPPGYQVRVVPLRYVGVQEIQKVIEPMMPPKSVIRADETRNLLILGGVGEEMEGVLDTIRLFDVDFMRGMSVGLYPLKNVEPITLAEELDKVLGDTAKGPLAGVVRLMAVERLNAVMAITSQPRYLDEVQTWVERLDRYSSTRAGGVHVYRVQNVDAMELADTLSNIFGQGGGGGSGGRSAGQGSVRPGSGGTTIGGIGGGLSGSGGGDNDGSSTGSSLGGSSGLGGGGLGSSSSASGSRRFGSGSSSGGLGGSRGGGSALGSSRGGSGGFSAGGALGSSGGAGGSGRQGRGSVAADLGNMRIVADPANNALIIMAKAQDYKEIEAVIKELDVLPLQVLIEATIAEIVLSNELKYGLQWMIQHGSFNALLGKTAGSGSTNNNGNDSSSSTTTNTTSTGSANLVPLVASAFPAGGLTYSFLRGSGDIQAVLSALASNDKLNVLSSPSLMVLNNQEASIKVGDQVPTLTSQVSNLNSSGITTTNAGLTSASSIQYRDTGVLLTVRPRVNAGGLVIMDLEQAVDDVKVTTNSTINSPTIVQRQIKSAVAVKSGETLVLGGLIKENGNYNKSGIPWLYELPVIGSLFGTTSKTVARTELVVLLTPRVVESHAKTRDITNEFKRKLTGLMEGLSETHELMPQ